MNIDHSIEYQYDPGRYRGIHKAFPQVWHALCDQGVVERMKLLSRRRVPAIAALDIDAQQVWTVLENARDLGKEDQVKQMIGHQTRQIMESEGFVKSVGKPIPNSWIFTWGMVYRRPEWRWLCVHRNKNREDQYCVSVKRRLSSLRHPPVSCSKWTFYRMCATKRELNFVLAANLEDDFGWTWRSLCREVRENGYVTLNDRDPQ